MIRSMIMGKCLLIFGLVLIVSCAVGRTEDIPEDRPPNIIIFLTDDQGYNDVGCFGSPEIQTPHFDRMAAEGTRFTSFYAQPVCGPSRAALMTGCYPIRLAEPGNRKHQHTVPHADEVTLAEVLRDAGYRTACVGKWHLAGERSNTYDPELLPLGQGFQEFHGTPLHNGYSRKVNHRTFKTQLMRGNEILNDALTQEEMNLLTRNHTKEAIRFIRENRRHPFFLYLAHNMPHVPLGASPEFQGRSSRGLYGDVIEELDWSMGQILQTLQECGIDENTLLIFFSDNGPWIEEYIGDYGGSAAPLRGWKMSAWEGGPRVPCIMRWPNHIPAGRICGEVTATLDIFPTCAALAGAALPEGRILDGKDLRDVWMGKPNAKNPRETFLFYNYLRLNAVRKGKWKLVFPRKAKPPGTGWSGRMIDAVHSIELYDLDKDVSESRNVRSEHPDVVRELQKVAEDARNRLGNHDQVGKEVRFFDGPRPLKW